MERRSGKNRLMARIGEPDEFVQNKGLVEQEWLSDAGAYFAAGSTTWGAPFQ